MNRHSPLFALLTASIVALLAACGGDATAPRAKVVSVSITGPASVAMRTNTQLAAALRDAKGNALADRAVSWTSGNATVATISTLGIVLGVSIGPATITGTSEGVTGQLTISVTPPPVASVTVSPASMTMLGIGATFNLGATLRESSGNVLTDRSLTWSSSNAVTATVSQAGLVTAAATGTVTISATSEGRTGTASVVVPAPFTSAFGRVSVSKAEVDSREPSGCLGGNSCYVPSDPSSVFVRVSFMALDRPVGLSSAEFPSLFGQVTLSGTGLLAKNPSVIASYVGSPRFYVVFVAPRTVAAARLQLTWTSNPALDFTPSAATQSSASVRDIRASVPSRRVVAESAPVVERRRTW